MNTAFRHIITFVFLLLLLSGCKKFVEIDPPTTQLVTPSVFNSNATATSAQTAIYTKMVSNTESFNMSLWNGLLSDELNNYLNTATNLRFYQNDMTPTTVPNNFWNNWYNYIYQENAIIAAVQNNNAISPAVAQQLMGEAKFVRAFWHFNLINVYGDVPLVITTDYTANSSIFRTPQAQVYQQILVDLKDAENLLNNGYVDASDTTVYSIATAERVRPTKSAAAAMLARAYLYTSKFDSAEARATFVINNTSMFSLSPLTVANDGFTKNNTEAIWQLYTPLPATNGATSDGQNFILVSVPNNVAMSSQLYNSFEPGDKRKNIWVGSYTTTTTPFTPYYFPYKYRSTSATNGSNVIEYVMVLRLAEQYLIRAEARAQQNNLSGAIADLNIIRQRANLPVLSSSLNQAQVLAAVMQERRVELFCEWGHRWFDLKRTSNINSVMGTPGNVCQAKGGTWSTDGHQLLYPIPLTEILNDPNLVQNKGY